MLEETDGLKEIEKKIIEHLNKTNFDINDFLEKNNNEIFSILLLFKVNEKGNYLIKGNMYANNLRLLNKLFNCPKEIFNKIKDDFYKNQLKFLINKLTEGSDNFLDIFENIRLLINLIIYHKDINLIYEINFKIDIGECKEIDKKSDTFKKISKLLNKLLFNNDFNSNGKGIILTGGAGDEDKILTEKKINYINLNLLFNLIKDLKEAEKDKIDEKKDDIVKIFKLIDDKKDDDIKKIIDNIVKIETIDLKKTIITEFNKNINRFFKDDKGKDITEENIIKYLCDKTFNLETLINNKKLRELIKLKELAPGTNLFYYYYNLGITSKRHKFIDNIEQLLSINDFCTITYNIYPPTTEVKFQDIIYIENSKYNLPIIYDDKRNDSYDIIELIFNILKNNDIDYKSKIKKLLLDFNNEFIISDDNIEKLKKLNINEKLFEKKRGDIVKEIKTIETTKKCLDYMNITIDFYKTEIARILSYNLPKFYEEKSSSQDVSFDIDTLFKDSNYVSDNIVKNNFLKLNLKDYKYNDKYYPIEKYITLKELYYFQKNVSLETIYSFCNDEKNTYYKEDFIKEIKNRIINDNLNLNDYIDISYILYDKYDKEKKIYYLKNYKCQVKDILTLKSNLSFNYLSSLDHNKIVYDLDIYYNSTNTNNKDLNSSIEFYKYLYLYFLNDKINKIKYSSTIYDHCKEKIKEFIQKKITNLELKKPIELEFFENIEKAKENLKYKLEKILKTKLDDIDLNKSYEEIIFEVLKENKDNNDLLKHIDIKKFKRIITIDTFEKEVKDKLDKNLLLKEYYYKFSIDYNKKSNSLSLNKRYIQKEYSIKDFLILKDNNLIYIRELLINIAKKKEEVKDEKKKVDEERKIIKDIEIKEGKANQIKKDKEIKEVEEIKKIYNFYNLKINVKNLKDDVKIKALEIYNLLNKNPNFKPRKKLIINKDIEEEEEENEILGGSSETDSYNTYIYKYIDKSLQKYLIKILEDNRISIEPISLNIFKQLEEKKDEFIEKNNPKIKSGSYEYVINEHYKDVKSKVFSVFKKTFKLSIKKLHNDDKINKKLEDNIMKNLNTSKKFNLELSRDDKINVNEYENGLFDSKDFIQLNTDNIDFCELLNEIIKDTSYKNYIEFELKKAKEERKKAIKENDIYSENIIKSSLEKDDNKIKDIASKYNLNINVKTLKDEVRKNALEIYNLLKKNPNFKPRKLIINKDIEDEEEEENEILGGSREKDSYNTYIYKYIDKSLQIYLIKILKDNHNYFKPVSLKIFKQLEEKKEQFIKKLEENKYKNIEEIKSGSYEYVINEYYKKVEPKKTDNLNKNLSIKKLDKEAKNNEKQKESIINLIISSKKFNLELSRDDKINVNEYENGLFDSKDFIQLNTDNIDFSELLNEIIKDTSYKNYIDFEFKKAKDVEEKADKAKKETEAKDKADKDKKIKKLLKLNELKDLKKIEIIGLTDDVKDKASEIYDLLVNIPKFQIQFGNLIINEDIEDEEEENEILGGGKYDEINKSYETTMYSYIIKSLINYLKDILTNKNPKEPITLKYFKELETAKEKFIIDKNIDIKVKVGSYEYILYKYHNNNLDNINYKSFNIIPGIRDINFEKNEINLNNKCSLRKYDNNSLDTTKDQEKCSKTNNKCIDFNYIDFIKLKTDSFNFYELFLSIINDTIKDQKKVDEEKAKKAKEDKDEKIKKLLKIDLLKQIEFKEFNKEVKDIAIEVYDLLNKIPNFQIQFGNLIINEDIEEEEEEILGGGIYDEINKSYETIMYSYIIKSLINYLYDILNSNKIPNKSLKKYIPDTLNFFQNLEEAKIKIKQENDKIDTKFSYEHCLKQYFKIDNDIKQFTFKKITNEKDSYFYKKDDIIKDIFDNKNLIIQINDIPKYKNLIDLIQFKDDIFDMIFLNNKFLSDTDKKKENIKKENEKKEKKKEKENEKNIKKEINEKNIEDYKKLFNLEEFKEFENDYKDEIKTIAYNIYELLNNIPKFKKKFDPNYKDKDNDDDINKSYESIIYNYIINSLINYLENIFKKKNIRPPISLKIFQDLEMKKQKFITDKKPEINEGSYEYVIYKDYKKKNYTYQIAIKIFNNESEEKKIIQNLELNNDEKKLFNITSNSLNIVFEDNGKYEILDFIKMPNDKIDFYDLLKEIIEDDKKKIEYKIEHEVNFKKLFNLYELKIYKNRTISKENKEKAIEVYNLLNKIPKYQIIFGNLFINKDIEDEEEENEILGGSKYDEINKSYNTKMYKFIIKSLINYLKNLFRNFTINIPFSLTFFKELEEAKEKLIINLKKNIDKIKNDDSSIFTKIYNKFLSKTNLTDKESTRIFNLILDKLKIFKENITFDISSYSYEECLITLFKKFKENFLNNLIKIQEEYKPYYIGHYINIFSKLFEFKIKLDDTNVEIYTIIYEDKLLYDNKEYKINNIVYNTLIDNIKLIGDKFNNKFLKQYFTEKDSVEKTLGGYKNIIELEDVFKLYYNSDESITNIYKLYFIINIYGNYYQDDKVKYELIENILEIIKIDVLNDDIIETINNLITNIYNKTRKIYEFYIRYFDKTDTIIKNYCQKRNLINKYLNMNFIYELYKNYQKKDINIQVNINGTILKIEKSLIEINKEIDDLFINGEGLFPKSSYNISMNSYDNEIDNFIHFIYDFTKNQSTISLTNLNDLNAFIVLQLLSNENDMINLVINGDTYMINNINNHPYKLHMTENFNIQIKLNDIQMGLYKQLFEMKDKRSLLGILAKDYYYLDFNIREKSRFKFHLNYEIIPFISSSKIDDDFKRTIINYNSFKPKMIEEMKDLSILSLEKNSLIFLINYGILLTSTLFSQINIKNFISLIHIYLIFKNNTKRYLHLVNYNGDNETIILYRDYIKSINYIGFLKSALCLMRVKIELKMDLKAFIKRVINFKENIFIKSVIKIDVNFLQFLFNIETYKIDNKMVEDFYLSFLLVYKNCLKEKVNINIINMFHIFIIPNLRFFHNKINIRDIENEVLDIKAKEYIRLIRGIKGGDGEKNFDKDIKKAKNELKDIDNVLLTTDLSDNTKEILKLLQVFNDIYIEFNKLDLIELINDFKKILEEVIVLSEEGEIHIIDEDKINIFKDKLNFKDNSKKYEEELRKIKSKIDNNIGKIGKVINSFSYNAPDDKEDELNNKAKILRKILKYMKEIEKSLNDDENGIKKYKEKSAEVNNLFIEFFPIDEEHEPLMENINEFVKFYKQQIDIFVSYITEAKNEYDKFSISIKENEADAKKFFGDEERIQTEVKNDIVKDLKEKKREHTSELNRLIDKVNRLKDDIERNNNKIYEYENQDKDREKFSPEIKKLQVYNKSLNEEIIKKNSEIEQIKKNIKELDDSINKERKSSGGGKPIKDKLIVDLLDKNKTPFKYKGDNVSFDDKKNEIKKRFDHIKKDYRKLKVSTYIPNSVHKDMILEKFINNKGDTLFEQILNNYQQDVKEKNQDIAKANFYESVENNNLDPIKELEITFIDKLIFAFLIIFLRYAGLYLTYRFIDNKYVKSIKEAVIYYSLSYVAVLFAFLVIVNIDLFRLRIIFNYCNLHVNSSGILSHMIIKIIIGYVIYLLIINLDNEPIPTYLSKNQIIKLKKKIDILSMIVIVFLLIFVLII